MHIYIDESGTFVIPADRRGPAISCAGALIVPESQHEQVVATFLEVSRPWPKEDGEIKGKLLDEAHIESAIGVLARHGCLFDCVAIDLGLHRVQEVNDHKGQQAANLLAAITPRHQPTLIAQVRDLAARQRALSVPEYLQMVVLTQLVRAVLSTKVMFFAQTAPQEIGAFRWSIDAKDRKLTRSEKVWNDLVLPSLESQSLREPFLQLIGADYSAYRRFEIEAERPPEHIAPHVKSWRPGQPYLSSDIRLVMNEHRQFANSQQSVGLQMADVATNAAARALKGHLNDSGWRQLGTIMLQQIDDNEVIRLVRLHPHERYWRPDPPYYRVLRHLRRTARPLLVMAGAGQAEAGRGKG